MTLDPAPPLRADARRNRTALLEAARRVFAEHGLDAPLDAIAKDANVGRATLYRRFPTRDDLVAAIATDELDTLAEVVGRAEDPDRAYFDFMDCALHMQEENLGFIELFTRPIADRAVINEIGQRFYAIVTPILERAQQAGLVRPDLLPSDTGSIILMLGAVTSNLRNVEQSDVRRRRVIELLLDAQDPSGAPRPLPPLG